MRIWNTSHIKAAWRTGRVSETLVFGNQSRWRDVLILAMHLKHVDQDPGRSETSVRRLSPSQLEPQEMLELDDGVKMWLVLVIAIAENGVVRS
jgi:hypothetical protein